MATSLYATSGQRVQARISRDAAAGKPIVVHVVVALCDNVHQGIVPVSKSLGNGKDPANNLYWGALYGVKSYFKRLDGWSSVKEFSRPENDKILDRAVFLSKIVRGKDTVPVYVVADAWDGEHIKDALLAFEAMVAMGEGEDVVVKNNSGSLILKAGGNSHLIAYVGHNGLMDFKLKTIKSMKQFPERSVVVLACASKDYFQDRIVAGGAHPLLLTTGLMAPEAYTLEAVIRAWISDQDTKAVTEAAASAYNRYQQSGIKAARRLFWGAP